jgi:Fur family zinc uptake transcriptional regulator
MGNNEGRMQHGEPHHDHDHQVCRVSALDRAERECRDRGLRLTAQRRLVLDVMLDSHAPVTAYEIMDRIAVKAQHRPSPISVYRALDFLTANGFVHRIESRNAFLACSSEHSVPPTGGRPPALLFMLCEACGAASEAESADLSALIGDLAAGSDFAVTASVLEVKGLCAACRASGALPRSSRSSTPELEQS